MTAGPNGGPVRGDLEVDGLVRALRSYGVLTRGGLREFSGAFRWPDHNFGAALRRGIAEGSIKSLGASMYDVGEHAPDLNEGRFGPP
jgi:hypothetical protein